MAASRRFERVTIQERLENPETTLAGILKASGYK
jgi:hypothetical protein